MKFKLVNTLNISLELENKSLEIKLSDYEYFYQHDTNTFFYKNSHIFGYRKGTKKNDINFCSAIAEAFSALIDVDAQRQQIRELFSNSSTNRDDIIREEFDDRHLEKLISAKDKLGITNDTKWNFWKSFVKCFPSKKN